MLEFDVGLTKNISLMGIALRVNLILWYIGKEQKIFQGKGLRQAYKFDILTKTQEEKTQNIRKNSITQTKNSCVWQQCETSMWSHTLCDIK